MNILFLTQVLPYPLDAGPKVRGYYNLRYLSENHAVTLLSFTRPSDTPEALSHLNSLCTRVETVLMRRSRYHDGLSLLKSLLINQPFLILRDVVSEMDLTLRKLIRENRFEVIHADQLWMAPYACKAQREAIKIGYRPRIILDQHNAVHLIPKRMAETSRNRFLKTWLKREASLMAKFELETCQQFDHVVWVSSEDFEAVSAINRPLNNVSNSANKFKNNTFKNSIIPICLDPGENAPLGEIAETKEILFVGGMHWPPNADGVVWFTKEILPKITSACPNSRFIAVGRQPPKGININDLNVITPGHLKNIDSYWKSSRVFVVPLRAGGGIRVKILDSWSRGIPIVSTTIGAEGIICQNGRDILIADTAEDFASAVLKLLMDDNIAVSLSRGGRQALEKYYDWRKIYTKWDSIYPKSL